MARELAVRLDVYIEAPPERVWRSLASETGWRAWFNPTTTLEPRLQGRFRVQGEHGGKPYAFAGRVITFDPPRELAVSWIPEDPAWPFKDLHSIVRFVLEPVGTGTRVRLAHEGFERLPEEYRFAEYEGFARGWRDDEELAWLRDHVEQGVSHFR